MPVYVLRIDRLAQRTRLSCIDTNHFTHNNSIETQVVRVAQSLAMTQESITSEQWPLMAWNILLQACHHLVDGNLAYATFQ